MWLVPLIPRSYPNIGGLTVGKFKINRAHSGLAFTRTAEGEECIARKDLWQRFSARRNNGAIEPLESVPSMNGSASGSIHSPSSAACGGPEGCVTVKNNPILINRKNKLAADSTMLHRRRRRPKLWLGKVVLERFTVARFNTDSGVGGLE